MVRPSRAGRTRTAPTLLRVGAVLVAVFCLLPFGYVLASGVAWRDVADEFRYPATVATIEQTVALVVVISLMTVVIGVGTALLVVRTDLPCPRAFTVLFAMPLAIPGFVSAYAAYSTELVYAPRLGFVSSFCGASLVISLTLYPYVFLPSIVALRRIDPALEEVAQSLTKNRFAGLIRVVIPSLRPAIAGGSLIVALHVLAEYGGMVQLGRSTLTTKVMGEMLDYGDYRSARSLALLLAVLAIVVLVAARIVAGGPSHQGAASGSTRPPRQWLLAGWRPFAVAFALCVPLIAVGPTVLMTMRGLLNPARHVAIAWGQVLGALSASLAYAVVAAVLATVLALPVSWWVSRWPSRAASLTERSIWLAHAIPSAILGLGMVFLATRLVPSMYKTPTVLIAAYLILFLPLAVANQRVGLASARPNYDDAAASLGARPWRALVRISLPLALPGFLVGGLLVGLDASKELNATLMLLPFNSQTLATRLWATTNGESLDFTAAAPYAGLLVLLGVPPVLLLVRQTLKWIDRFPAAQQNLRRDLALVDA